MRFQFGLFTAILLTTLGFSRIAERRRPDLLQQPLDSIPRQLAGWVRTADQSIDAATLSKLLPTSYLSSTYQRGSERLDVLVVYYAQQRAGESMHSPKHCLPGSGWEIWQQDSMFIPIANESFRINQHFIRNGLRRAVVLYWYQSKKRIIASEYAGKLFLVRDAIVDGRTGGSLVRIVVPDTPEAIRGAAEFAAHLIPELKRCFGS